LQINNTPSSKLDHNEAENKKAIANNLSIMFD